MVAVDHDSGRYFNDGPRPLLSWAQPVVWGPSYHCPGVGEDRVPSASLLPGLKRSHGPVDGVKLGVEGLFVAAQEETPAPPAILCLP